MDSTGLRVLLGAHQRAHESGRRFALVRGADQVERVLTLTGVRDLLTVVDAPEELWPPASRRPRAHSPALGAFPK